MRFAMHTEHSNKGSQPRIAISAKRNNWRPKEDEIELPACLDHVAHPHLRKVGQRILVPESSPTYPLLLRYIQGDDPERREIDRVAESLAHRVVEECGLVGQIRNACVRMRRRGLDNPEAPTLIADRLFQILKKRVNA